MASELISSFISNLNMTRIETLITLVVIPLLSLLIFKCYECRRKSTNKRQNQSLTEPDGGSGGAEDQGLSTKSVFIVSTVLAIILTVSVSELYSRYNNNTNTTLTQPGVTASLTEIPTPNSLDIQRTPDILNRGSSDHPIPSPSPISTTNVNSCDVTKMSMPDFYIIDYGTSVLKLVDLLSDDWVNFWMIVGFKLPILAAQARTGDSDTDANKKQKLNDILDHWIQGKFSKRGNKPTYETLVRLLNNIELNDLARDFKEAYKGNMMDTIDLSKLYFIEYQGKQVRVAETLKDYWVEFGMVIGYPVVTKKGNKDSFIHFCSEWLQQRLSADKRDKYPNTFEGFRKILIANDKYVEKFTSAVEQAGKCKFSTGRP